MDYKESGVDIEKGDLFVKKIASLLGHSGDSRVIQGVGGFAALYQMDEKRLLASGTDGVGTKVKIAQRLNRHDTIGIDLVAMCANDIICTGAKPLFFLDYLACGSLDVKVAGQIIEGIVCGCQESKMALIGGETAEMPGVYSDGVYDLAGFAVGEVDRDKLLDGSRVEEGDYIVGLASSGFHSNGYSLVRRLLETPTEWQQALTPTTLYVETAHSLLDDQFANIKGFAHITGGGFHNIARINKKFGYCIDRVPSFEEIPSLFKTVCQRSGASFLELYSTFNMGVGFAIVCGDVKKLEAKLKQMGHNYWILGRTSSSCKGIQFDQDLIEKWTYR